jgi:hypothetical protein
MHPKQLISFIWKILTKLEDFKYKVHGKKNKYFWQKFLRQKFENGKNSSRKAETKNTIIKKKWQKNPSLTSICRDKNKLELKN